MAGFYSDVPAPRMAYDVDGTIVVSRSVSSTATTDTVLTELQKVNLNNESTDSITVSDSTSGGNYGFISFCFPEIRDLNSYFVSTSPTAGTSTPGSLYYSTDTTNAVDGTWTLLAASMSYSRFSPKTYYRTSIDSAGLTIIKGFRFAVNYPNSVNFRAIHLYGTRPTVTDRLALWDPSSDVALSGSYLDFGDLSRGETSSTKSFRIKNLSSTLTANTVSVSVSGATDGSPANSTQYTFSTDNVTFNSTVSIASISPGSISSAIYVKKTIPSNANLSLWTARIKAEPASWS